MDQSEIRGLRVGRQGLVFGKSFMEWMTVFGLRHNCHLSEAGIG